MPTYVRLTAGDPAPWFRQRTKANPRFSFDTTAGRYLVLCFFATAQDPQSRAAIDAALARRDLFDDRHASFFGVSMDPSDESDARIEDQAPGFRYFFDFDATASRAYGVAPTDTGETMQIEAHRKWVIIDPTLRIIDVIPFERDRSDIGTALARVAALPPPASFAGIEVPAPILILPRVFEREFCRDLIALYETHGGEESGFMREVDGRTVAVHDYGHKRRRDHNITDQATIDRAKALVQRRVIPEILKVHQFRATRMERYIVACYDAAERAHFNAHRDNTTSGTAHRRFAVSINLNDDYEGGDVYFPEYGRRIYRAPPGGAVVFSCSLLHAVTPMTRGRRFAFLPFLYDDAAAALRESNNERLAEGVGAYKAR